MIRVSFTVDTEPDNVWRDFRSQSLANIDGLGRFQRFVTERGVAPTYLITHSVVTDARAARVLHELRDIGPLEIGTHLHAWETPPFLTSQHDQNHQVFAHELPSEHVHAKLEALTRLIRNELGQPVSYRAGRFGFNASHIRILESLGYIVDSSITPLADRRRGRGLPLELGGKGGRDYRSAPLDPYHPSYENDLTPGSATLLEIPVTVGPTRRGGPLVSAYRYGPDLLQRLLRKAGLSDLIIASVPEIKWPLLESMIRTAIADGHRTITFILHSSETMVGGAPWIQTEDQLEGFYDRLGRCINLLSSYADARFMTLGDVARNWLGAENPQRRQEVAA